MEWEVLPDQAVEGDAPSRFALEDSPQLSGRLR